MPNAEHPKRKSKTVASVVGRWIDRRNRLEDAELCDTCIDNWTMTALEEPDVDLPAWVLESIFKCAPLRPPQIAELRSARRELAAGLRRLRAAGVSEDVATDIFLFAEMPEANAAPEPDPAPSR